jgi:hypothetical protein
VREFKRSAEQTGLAAEKRGSAGSSTSKLIRVGDSSPALVLPLP